MAYPSTITAYTNPIPTDRLNSPSHSSIETAQNTGLTEIQTYIGVTTGASASAIGTLLYDIKGPGSNGGGHVQTANKGGTGQTTFTKGDILIATNSSTLAKLAVGVDGQTPVADSSVAAGIKWSNQSNNKIYTNASTIQIRSATETSIFSTSVLGSTLGTSGAVRSNTYLTRWQFGIGTSVIAAIQYGGQTVASVALIPTISGSQVSTFGAIQHTMIANAATNSQKHFLDFNFTILPGADQGIDPSRTVFGNLGSSNSMIGIRVSDSKVTSSINSSANQIYGMTIRTFSAHDVDLQGTVVEKIN